MSSSSVASLQPIDGPGPRCITCISAQNTPVSSSTTSRSTSTSLSKVLKSTTTLTHKPFPTLTVHFTSTTTSSSSDNTIRSASPSSSTVASTTDSSTTTTVSLKGTQTSTTESTIESVTARDQQDLTTSPTSIPSTQSSAEQAGHTIGPTHSAPKSVFADSKAAVGVFVVVVLVILVAIVALTTLWVKRRRRRITPWSASPPRYDTSVAPFFRLSSDGHLESPNSIMARFLSKARKSVPANQQADAGNTSLETASLSDPPPYSENPGLAVPPSGQISSNLGGRARPGTDRKRGGSVS